MLNVNKILVPTDFSEYSDLALKKAIECAATCDATIHLAYVMPEVPDIFKLSKYMAKGKDQIQKELEDSCQSYFEKQLETVQDSGSVKIKIRVLSGIPFKEILRFEEKLKPDMVVITAQGETAFEEFIFGGTASKIIRYAKCSVLLVKRPKYPKTVK